MGDSTARLVHPLADDGRRATVLIFAATTCPISNSYAPEISRITKQFGPYGFRTYLVLTDDSLSASAASQYKASYFLACPVVIDSRRQLVTAAGAVVTPEAVVLNSRRQIVYRGRIDNKFADFGISRQTATSFDLLSALTRLKEGKSESVTETKAIGCFIQPPSD